MPRSRLDAQAAGRVALGIDVDHQGRSARLGQPGREVDRGRRLADAPLLIGHADDLGHRRLLCLVDRGVDELDACAGSYRWNSAM